MSTTPTASNPFQPANTAQTLSRRIGNVAAIALTGLFTAFAVVFLLYLILFVLRQGVPYLNKERHEAERYPKGDSHHRTGSYLA